MVWVRGGGEGGRVGVSVWPPHPAFDLAVPGLRKFSLVRTSTPFVSNISDFIHRTAFYCSMPG